MPRTREGSSTDADKLIFSVRTRYFYSRKRFLRQIRKLADAARDGRQHLTAAHLYAAVLEEQPGNAAIHVQAGHMFKEAGELVPAETHYLHARILMPNDPDLHLQLGHFYKMSNRLYEAVAAYKQAAVLKPDWTAPAIELASLQAALATLVRAEDFSLDRASSQGAAIRHGHPLDVRPRLTVDLTIDKVRQSGLFDATWYRKRYADVTRLGIDPLVHFVNDGIREGRLPGPGFDPDWYRETYQDTDESGLDPFSHYILAGREKGYAPAGPPLYQRWVAAFDTLTDEDITAIDRHIAETGLIRPRVVLVADRQGTPSMARAVQGLRRQRLKPKVILVCMAPDCHPATATAIRALVGSDPAFVILGKDGAGAERFAGTGPVVLLDCGVELREHALCMLMSAWSADVGLVYADEDRVDDQGGRCRPQFKPGASPELLRQAPYLGSCVLLGAGAGLERLLADLATGRRTVAQASYDAFITAGRRAVRHTPYVLYHDHAEGRPIPAPLPPVSLDDADLPTVTVIIPTRDRVELLRLCIESLRAETDYPRDRLEIIVVDNGSETHDALEYLRRGVRDLHFRVIHAPIPFNYSRLNNIAAAQSTADLLVLLNNDTEIQDPAWLRRLADYAMQDDVGAAGPKLLYPDGTIQHAGIVLGIDGIAAHAHLGLVYDAPGVMGLAQQTHEVAAVTGACLAIRRSVYHEVGGLDVNLPVAFNDVLLCLACLDRGYRNIYVHDVWVRHAESKSRGLDDTQEKMTVFLEEAGYARGRFPTLFEHDPYYNPNLSLTTEHFYLPAFPPRARLPWREHAIARQSRKKVLVLSASLSSAHDIGATAAMQARFLADLGYDVVVGCPDRHHGADLGSARRVTVDRPEAAASYAVQHAVDCIIVHSWPFLKVARLLGRSPVTVLYDHGAATLEPARAAGARWSAQVERVLADSASTIVVAASAEIAGRSKCRDMVICPPGADRLGKWSPALLPTRNQVRRARNWEGMFVIVVGAGHDHGKGFGDRLAAIASELNSDRVLWVASSQLIGSPARFDILPLDHFSTGELAELYVAADLYVEPSGPERSTLASLEAASLGLPVVSFDIDETGRDSEIRSEMISRLLEAASLVDQHHGWRRTSAGLGWGNALAAFEAVVAKACGTVPMPHGQPAPQILSERQQISQSGLFDPVYYTDQYPGDAPVAKDPISHYIAYGWRENRRPSALFHGDWYVSRYPKILASGLNPLTHYLLQPFGTCDPNPYFSNEAYIRANPGAPATGLAPFVHYLRSSLADRCTAGSGPGFDPHFYVQAYPDQPLDTDPLVDFLQRGEPEGRLAIRPIQTAVNAYSKPDLERIIGEEFMWEMPGHSAVTDIWSAARFCIELLCRSHDLRRRFPAALSAGSAGDFARWLAERGSEEYGLSRQALAAIAELFREDISARILQAYLTRRDTRMFPFALTPAGLGPFLAQLYLSQVKTGHLRIEPFRWFALVWAENPQLGLVRTYQFTPMLQRRFPLGLTLFGRQGFADWLTRVCRFKGDWLDPRSWPEPSSWPEQLRLAYCEHPGWHQAQPAPFTSEPAARAFMAWLLTRKEISDEARQRLSDADPTDRAATELTIPGINMLGHFCYPSGLRTSTEALVAGYRSRGNNVALRDVWVHQDEVDPYHSRYTDPEVYDTTVIHVQPEPTFDTAYVRAGLTPRRPRTYRIGYWYWELGTVPAAWDKQAGELDEIWTATRFVADALRTRFDMPIHEILPGLELPAFMPLPRAYFGLPDEKFLFLFTFHMTSIMERKNPLGLIKAFRAAFDHEQSVGLVIKTSFGALHPELLIQLKEAAGSSGITIIDSVYTQTEVLSLMQCCDSYVSLHRSEGYGLTMAEAMLMGKPVIATGYSGNLDFMTPETGLLVKYNLVTLDRAYGPYAAGSRWADPSVHHAAACMRRVAGNRDWALALGRRAKADLTERMSYQRSGAKMSARLAEIAAGSEAAGRDCRGDGLV